MKLTIRIEVLLVILSSAIYISMHHVKAIWFVRCIQFNQNHCQNRVLTLNTKRFFCIENTFFVKIKCKHITLIIKKASVFVFKSMNLWNPLLEKIILKIQIRHTNSIMCLSFFWGGVSVIPQSLYCTHISILCCMCRVFFVWQFFFFFGC